MEAAAISNLSAAEYLALERRAETKNEYLDGEMFAMAGGTERHSLIAGNLIREPGNQLEGKPRKVFTSDMRLKVQRTALDSYPDVQVACGDSKFEDASRDVLLNPSLLVEVLSDSTAAWDRGGKFWHYRQLESPSDYVLVSQDVWLVEHYTRQASGAWLREILEGNDGILDLKSIGCQLALREIHANTDLQPQANPSFLQPKNRKTGPRP